MASLSEVLNPTPQLPKSLWHMLQSSDGQHLAVSVLHQPASHLSDLIGGSSRDPDFVSWNFAQLRKAAELVSLILLDHGVERGMRLFTLLPNGVENVLLTWVSVILQLTLVPLDKSVLDPDRQQQLEYYLNGAEDDKAVVIVANGAAAGRIEQVRRSTGRKLRAKCILGEGNSPGWISLAQVSSPGDVSDSRLDQIEAIDQGGDRVAVVLHTSGTSTGKPKGVPLSVRNVLAACMNQVGLAELTDCFLTSSPNFGVIFSFMVLTCGAWGMEVLMPAPAFSPTAVLNAMRRYSSKRISTICIPAQIRLLSNELAKADYGELNSMKRLMLGGDLATKDVLQQAQKLFPSAKLSTSYGMTEACGVIGFLGSSIERMPTYKGIISLGKPVAGSNVRIVKPVDDGECGKGLVVSPRNEVGDLHLGGPCVAQQYVDNVQPEAFYRDGYGSWLITGDRALMDDEGYVFIVGRTKDIVKKMGQSLSPALPETILRQQPGVEGAVVVGIPQADYGEVPVAVIRPSDQNQQLDRERLSTAVANSLGEYYTLARIFTLKDLHLDDWPLNPTGKVIKVVLRERVVAAIESSE